MHHARVAIRKLRSLLRTLRPLLDEPWAETLRDRLKDVSDRLSAARDADVILARIDDALRSLDATVRLAAAPLLEDLARDRQAAYADVAAMRRDGAYAQTLELVREAVQRPKLAAGAQRKHVARTMLRTLYRRCRRRVRRCRDAPTDTRLHDLRRAAKHLRYALEALAPIAGRRLLRVADRVQRLQDVLGEEHDAAVTAARLHGTQGQSAAFAAGALATLERRNAGAARTAWHKAWRSVAGAMD